MEPGVMHGAHLLAQDIDSVELFPNRRSKIDTERSAPCRSTMPTNRRDHIWSDLITAGTDVGPNDSPVRSIALLLHDADCLPDDALRDTPPASVHDHPRRPPDDHGGDAIGSCNSYREHLDLGEYRVGLAKVLCTKGAGDNRSMDLVHERPGIGNAERARRHRASLQVCS
jgi:hypothetical protein